jgi:hypothetical protein
VGKDRYAWFDIGANLTFYGPGPGGKGHVFDHSVPALSHYKAAAVSRAILPDLAALVWSACQVGHGGRGGSGVWSGRGPRVKAGTRELWLEHPGRGAAIAGCMVPDGQRIMK